MLLRKIRPNWQNLRWFKGKSYCKITPESLNIHCDFPTYKKLLLSFNNLTIDKTHNGLPIQFKRYAKYNVKIDRDVYSIYKMTKEEEVNSIEPHIIDNTFILNSITQTCALTLLNSKRKINEFDISLYQIRQMTYPRFNINKPPKGIHKNGADYIISDFVLNKENIIGGKSSIYNNNKIKIDDFILKENEGIYQNDKKLWHYISPVFSKNNKIGYRDIIRLNITIKPFQ